jgi:hypothetical protein
MNNVYVTKVIKDRDNRDKRLWVITLSTGSVHTYPMYLVRSQHAAHQRAIRDELNVS